MKNILLCNNAMGIGGVETVILNQVTAFTKKGYNVYVTAGKGIYSDKIEELGGKFIEFDYPEENKIDEARIKKLVEIIKDNQISEIHIHKYQCIPTSMIAAFITKIPYFAYEHGIRDTKKYYTWNYPLYKTLFPIYFSNAYKIIAITPKVAEITQKEYEIAPEKYEIIHNGIDFEEYKNEKPNYTSELNNVYIISRISEEKIFTILSGVDIFKKILKNNSNATLNIIGDGNQKEILKKYLEKGNLLTNGQVKMLGPKNNIKEYLEKADLLLGVDRCILEAIAMKVPAVITGYEGIKGLVSKSNINKALEENFSGDNLKTITIDQCIKDIDKLKEKKERIIEDNYAIAREKLDCYKNYINIPENTKIDFNWVELFKILEQQENIIQEQSKDIKAKYEWIQKIEKDNKELYTKKGELEESVKKEKQLREKNKKIKQELEEVYNSKRWRYTEKLSKLFHNKN